MNRIYLATPEGVSRLWQPVEGGLAYPSEAYIKQMREFIAPWGHTITEDRTHAYDASMGLLLAGTAFATKDLSVSRRGLFKLLGVGAMGLTLAQLLKADEVAAQFGGAGGADTNTFIMTFEGATAGFTLTTAIETWYHGNSQSTQSTGAFYIARQVCPAAGTITAVSFMAVRTGAVPNPLAQSIAHHLRVNNTTDTAAVNGTWDSAAGTPDKYSGSVSVAVSAGDDIVAKIVTPGWASSAPASPRFNAAGRITVA
ncbi:MAG: hypothetical protein K0S79_92 [Nitrospira sp.]|nr:hypothetical protein [Nitrospira sp.]